MTRKNLKDVDDAIANPSAHFDSPAEVVELENLSRRKKKEALDRWEEDARRLAVATEEGMTGGEPSRLTEIADAKNALGVADGEKRRSPTKAG